MAKCNILRSIALTLSFHDIALLCARLNTFQYCLLSNSCHFSVIFCLGFLAAKAPSRPSSAAKPAAGAGAGRYDPAAVYGQPMARKSKDNVRKSADVRRSGGAKRPPSAGGGGGVGGAKDKAALAAANNVSIIHKLFLQMSFLCIFLLLLKYWDFFR